MPAIVQTYLFGRLNIIGAWSDKRDFIFQGLTMGEFQIKGIFRYSFFNTRNLVHDGEEFVYGSLVKYKQILEGKVVDEETHQLVEDGLPLGVVAESDFFLHYQTTVIAFRPIANRLSPYQFREMFARLFETGHQNFFISAKLQSINEEYRLQEAIRSFQKINRVTFDIHPTNPSNREVYQKIDERLKNLQASRMRQIVEGGERGINKDILIQDETYPSLLMAIDGYGRGSIKGQIDGITVEINTDDSPVRQQIAHSADPKQILYQLMPAFRRIWDRKSK